MEKITADITQSIFFVPLFYPPMPGKLTRPVSNNRQDSRIMRKEETRYQARLLKSFIIKTAYSPEKKTVFRKNLRGCLFCLSTSEKEWVLIRIA